MYNYLSCHLRTLSRIITHSTVLKPIMYSFGSWACSKTQDPSRDSQGPSHEKSLLRPSGVRPIHISGCHPVTKCSVTLSPGFNASGHVCSNCKRLRNWFCKSANRHTISSQYGSLGLQNSETLHLNHIAFLLFLVFHITCQAACNA